VFELEQRAKLRKLIWILGLWLWFLTGLALLAWILRT
jgi:hypothetical protein